MPPELNLDPATLDLTRVVADIEAIRKIIPQRFEMEQLTAVIYEDAGNQVLAGIKVVTENEFWIRGHMPGYPLMPGVMMCEAAAQLCSFYITKHGLMDGDFIAFSGMDNVKFRGPVRIGDTLLLIAKVAKYHRRQTICNVQGFVKGAMVFQADIIGMPMIRPAGG
jgi:3-hydroxyacyl-[acyl-carrier-protein] dehydratase